MDSENNPIWSVYIIRCKDNSLYTGVTIDIQRRFKEHQSQGEKCAKYLRGKGPLQLVYTKKYESKREAMQEEIRLKRLTKIQKESLILSVSL